MNCRSIFVPASVLACAASFAIASLAGCASTDTHNAVQDNKTATGMTAHGDQTDMQLPPGWTMEDMQACMTAGMPGEMHQHLAKSAGVWDGKCMMWMAPGTEPMKSECTQTISMMMDGRYAKCEFAGDMPGMGPYSGVGFNGFDNVSQKFVSAWIDNHSSGIMQGVGEMTKDGKTMTWEYSYNCPIRKKTATMRQVDRSTGDNTMTMEMFMTDPKSGKEYKAMEIDFTKRTGATGM